MLSKVNLLRGYILHLVNLVADVENNGNYWNFEDRIVRRESNIRRSNNQKCHENLEIFSFSKKSVAFFQANPWLENSYKIAENQDNTIENSYKKEDLKI